MNVYQKVLVKIFEISGGKDSVDVDLIDLTKKEGFYSNIDAISSHLQDQGWMTERGRAHNVRITHWGAMEAKRLVADAPDKNTEIEKGAGRLLGEARELILMLEEFVAKPTAPNLDHIDSRIDQLRSRSAAVRKHLS